MNLRIAHSSFAALSYTWLPLDFSTAVAMTLPLGSTAAAPWRMGLPEIDGSKNCVKRGPSPSGLVSRYGSPHVAEAIGAPACARRSRYITCTPLGGGAEVICARSAAVRLSSLYGKIGHF